MKKLLLLICLLATATLASLTAAEAQQAMWHESNIISTPANVWSIFAYKSTLYASSWNNIFQSPDGGNTWKSIVLEHETIPKKEIFEGNYQSDSFGTFYFYSDKSLYRLPYASDTAELLLSFDLNSYRKSSLSLSLSNSGKTVVFSNGREVWVSHDYGISWKQIELDDEYKLDLELLSVTYDETYGIIKNYSTRRHLDNFNMSNYVFYSKDDGLSWYQLETIPGTSIPVNKIEVVNSSLWLVNGKTYDFQTKKYNSLSDTNYQHFFKTSAGYVISTDTSVWYSDDEGDTWSQMKTNIFDEYKYGWVDAFYADSAGTLYAGSRYGILKKSTDNGLTWTSWRMNIGKELDFFVVKNYQNQVHAFDNQYNRYVSKDNGKSWSETPFPNQPTYIIDYDITPKGEVIYVTNKLNYSPDSGKTWSTLSNGGASYGNLREAQLFDNGELIAYGARYSRTDMKFQKLNVHAYNLTLLKNGKYLSFNLANFYLLNSDLTTEERIDLSIEAKIGNYSHKFCYAVSNSQSLYVGTEKGLFKSETVSDNFDLISFPNQQVDQIFVDDNGYLYVRSGTAIYTSKNDGKTWLNINSNLGTESIQDIYAFGDGKIIAKSNGIYYADLKDAHFLTVTDSIAATDVYFNDTVTYNYAVQDENGAPVGFASVVLYNSVSNSFDTVQTDIKGRGTHKFAIPYYNQNLKRTIQFSSYAYKNGFFQSSLRTRNLTYHSEKKNLLCTSAPNYIITSPHSGTCQIPIALSAVPPPGILLTKGIFTIRNEYKGTTDTISYDGNGVFLYSFAITPNATLGMYKIIITGKNAQQETTTEHVTYVIISNSIQLYSSGDVKETSQPLFSLYPNPASEFITIDIPASVIIDRTKPHILEIFSLDGNRVLSRSSSISDAQTSERIDISGLRAGTYFVKLGLVRAVFIKQ